MMALQWKLRPIYMEDLDCIFILHFCLICLPGQVFLCSRGHFMKCIIVSLVKCKTGDLSDVNN
jgi:hypothetical protein